VKRKWIGGLTVAAVFIAPSAALACPVCFRALEAPIADAVNTAVLALLGVTIGVLAAFATFFIYLIRRARAATLTAAASEGYAHQGPKGMEGMAR